MQRWKRFRRKWVLLALFFIVILTFFLAGFEENEVKIDFESHFIAYGVGENVMEDIVLENDEDFGLWVWILLGIALAFIAECQKSKNRFAIAIT